MRPRLLLNENVPLPAARRLRAGGWDVLAIGESHVSADDISVMALACSERRWLMTFDRDYGELVFRRHLPPPPLILLLRVSSYLPEEPAAWIDSLYRAGELKEHHFCIFDGQTVRRRPLPVRSSDRRH
jgi:predicted nuclease of predicted toxin-antitoxin system